MRLESNGEALQHMCENREVAVVGLIMSVKRTVITSVESRQNNQDCDLITSRTVFKKITVSVINPHFEQRTQQVNY
jgi:hypothetical protein